MYWIQTIDAEAPEWLRNRSGAFPTNDMGMDTKELIRTMEEQRIENREPFMEWTEIRDDEDELPVAGDDASNFSYRKTISEKLTNFFNLPIDI